MKERFPSLFLSAFAVFLANPLSAQPVLQPQVSSIEGAQDALVANWEGVVGRVYFVQLSPDLLNWAYAPILKFGAGPQACEIATEGSSRLFLRLAYRDEPSVTTWQEAWAADFDSDGIPNGYEVENLGSDPLDHNSPWTTTPPGPIYNTDYRPLLNTDGQPLLNLNT
jgi:hypothetical protein